MIGAVSSRVSGCFGGLPQRCQRPSSECCWCSMLRHLSVLRVDIGENKQPTDCAEFGESRFCRSRPRIGNIVWHEQVLELNAIESIPSSHVTAFQRFFLGGCDQGAELAH